MAILDPTLAILDETDSGLDIDALRIVASGVNSLRTPERAMIIVTHYQRLASITSSRTSFTCWSRGGSCSRGRISRSSSRRRATPGWRRSRPRRRSPSRSRDGSRRGRDPHDQSRALARRGVPREALAARSPLAGRDSPGRHGPIPRMGFPTVHDEAWRETNVAPIRKVPFELAPDEESPGQRLTPLSRRGRSARLHQRPVFPSALLVRTSARWPRSGQPEGRSGPGPGVRGAASREEHA